MNVLRNVKVKTVGDRERNEMSQTDINAKLTTIENNQRGSKTSSIQEVKRMREWSEHIDRMDKTE